VRTVILVEAIGQNYTRQKLAIFIDVVVVTCPLLYGS
jgi:hypothetical protein